MTEPNPLPRELATGVFWLGECLKLTYRGHPLHSYNSVYLVTGDASSLLVEAGLPQELDAVESQLAALLSQGLPPLRYVFTTHTETPHAGGVGRWLSRYPDAVACGDVADLHLAFPEFASRLVPLDPGDSIDLGGTQFVTCPAIFRDMPGSRWGFDTRRRVLFSGDGFAYSHYHAHGHCGAVAEESGALDIPEMTSLFAELAFYWTRFVDIEPYLDRLDSLIFDELRVAVIAPTHGLPITDPSATMPQIRDGLRRGSGSTGDRGLE